MKVTGGLDVNQYVCVTKIDQRNACLTCRSLLRLMIHWICTYSSFVLFFYRKEKRREERERGETVKHNLD